MTSGAVTRSQRWFTSTCAMAVSFTWAVEDLLYVPFLRRSGGSEQLCSNIFLSNAVLGLLVTPVLAGWSDRLGRRHPFLLGGAVCSVVCSLSLGFMVELTQSNVATGSFKILFLVFSLAGCTEFGVDLMLTAGRSLLCDHAGGNEDELEKVNATYGLGINLGRFCGMVIGSLVGYLTQDDARQGFCLLACSAAAIVTGTALAIRNSPDVLEVRIEPEKPPASLANISRSALLLMLQCVFAWVAMLTVGMYFTSVVREHGFQNRGVVAPLAMAMQSASAIMVSHILPWLNRSLGTRSVHNAALVGYCACMVMMGTVTDFLLMAALMICTGITCAVIDCNPYILCESMSEGESTAQTVAMLDNTMNVAQVMCAIGLGQLNHMLGDSRLLFKLVGAGTGAIIIFLICLSEKPKRM